MYNKLTNNPRFENSSDLENQLATTYLENQLVVAIEGEHYARSLVCTQPFKTGAVTSAMATSLIFLFKAGQYYIKNENASNPKSLTQNTCFFEDNVIAGVFISYFFGMILGTHIAEKRVKKAIAKKVFIYKQLKDLK